MTTQADTLANLSPSTPLIADADTGYGGPIAVARTVSAYARAGVAALHLEDQVQEKRCGHLGGKQVVARETFWARIRAAANAREELGSEILIVARTDARQGLGFEEAVTRLRGAVEVGADVVFPEAMASREEAAEMVRRMGETPCLLNLVEGGVTPEVTVEEAREMGFRIVIFPVTAFEGAIVGIRDVLRKLKREGKMPATGVGVKDAFDLCGLQECVELDKKAGGKAYSNV
ncbi:Phosphoenolpyruvate/pyruvate domain-containing protein [Viridothelium virens]|uniref:Phosphoenolpyruvate/pyruvate domain-containing protein n=1 Tax=Viridothelium virens TaxID=1048519 RepID=A0A6A6H757_VIRVR|nr:Phosphoenolpyruvate/pyruvate domain-containing protein [Viridothelium virens]